MHGLARKRRSYTFSGGNFNIFGLRIRHIRCIPYLDPLAGASRAQDGDWASVQIHGVKKPYK